MAKKQESRFHASWSDTYQEWTIVDQATGASITKSNEELMNMIINELWDLKSDVAIASAKSADAERTADRASTAVISRSMPHGQGF